MRYKPPQSQHGTSWFIFGGFFVVLAICLLAMFYSDIFDRALAGFTNTEGVGMLMAVILLGPAAIMGIALAAGHFVGNRPPLYSVGVFHGSLAILGVISLVVAVLNGARGTGTQAALILFLAAVALGIVFFLYRRQRKALPKSLIVVHALLAVVGYLFLLRG